KAAKSLKAGAILVTLMPSPLLDSRSGLKWSKAITDVLGLRIHLLGRFKGFGYFRGAAVEPAFAIMRLPGHGEPKSGPVQIVLAESGFEDRALRSFRRDPEGAMPIDKDGFEVYQTYSWGPSPACWTPRPRKSIAVINSLKANK